MTEMDHVMIPLFIALWGVLGLIGVGCAGKALLNWEKRQQAEFREWARRDREESQGSKGERSAAP